MAGRRTAKAWETFFSSEKDEGAGRHDFAADTKIAQARARHEAALMQLPNVVGVSEGICMRKGKPTGEPCLVVYVERKVPRAQLGAKDRVPRHVDGVRTDVVEVGRLTPLPA